MSSANFKPKRTAAASRGFLATARLSCHYYEPRFQQLGYILPVESVYIRDQWRCAEADRDPQNIWSRGKQRSFVDATSSEV